MTFANSLSVYCKGLLKNMTKRCIRCRKLVWHDSTNISKYQLVEFISKMKHVTTAVWCVWQIKEWCVTVDAGEIPPPLITYLNEQQRHNQLKSAGGGTTDNIPSTDEGQHGFMTEMEQNDQATENRLQQNVTTADVQWPSVCSSQPDSLLDSSATLTEVDLDQCQEDWADILQCCDFSPTAAAF